MRLFRDFLYRKSDDKHLLCRPGEIAPGIPRPTTTLATMMAADILSNLDVESITSVGSASPMHTTEKTITEFSSFRRTETVVYHSHAGRTRAISYVFENGTPEFNYREKSIIEDAFSKFLSLRKQRQQLLKEDANQDLALKIIADRFKTEEDSS